MSLLFFQIIQKPFRGKVVIENELNDEALSELDTKAIEKSIIEVPDSEYSEVQ